MNIKSIFLAAALVAGLSAAAGTTAQPDTVTVIEQPSRVVITEDSTGTHVQVISQTSSDKGEQYNLSITHQPNDKVTTTQGTSDWNLRLPFKSGSTQSQAHWSVVCRGLYGGFGWVTSKQGSNNFANGVGHQYEVGLLHVLGLEYSTHRGQWFSLGMGIDWRRITAHDKQLRWAKNDAGVTDLLPYPDADLARGRHSNLALFSLTFPLFIRQKLGSDGAVWVAPTLRVNTGANLKASWKVDDQKTTLETRKLGYRPVGFDLMGGVALDGIGIYARWSPSQVFKAGRGPEFNTLTVGLILGI